MRTILTILALAATAFGQLSIGASSSASISAGSKVQIGQPAFYTVIVIPDPQYYVNSDSLLNRETAQYNWVAANKATLNIKAVVFVGDYLNAINATNLTNGDAAFAGWLGAGVPFIMPPGNHDYDTTVGRDLGTWDSHYGVPLQPHLSGAFNSSTSKDSWLDIGSFGSQPMGVIALAMCPTAVDFEWAQGILDAHPTYHFILTQHEYLNYTGQLSTVGVPFDCASYSMTDGDNGDQEWADFVSQNDQQIRYAVNGHFTGGTAARRSDVGAHGITVQEIFANYQEETNGGEGYLRIMKFYPGLRVDVTTFSPYLGLSRSDTANQFSVPW